MTCLLFMIIITTIEILNISKEYLLFTIMIVPL